MDTLNLTSLSDLEVEKHNIPAYEFHPNSPATKRPLYVYRSAFKASTSSQSLPTSAIKKHLSTTGVVEAQWTFSMYSTDHFHSTTHEVLVVARGKARLCFGALENPKRVELLVKAGDVMVLPAGVTHRLLEDISSEEHDTSTRGESFQMVGCYPVGADSWDMCYGTADEKEKIDSIGRLEWFSRDPIYGDSGPVLD